MTEKKSHDSEWRQFLTAHPDINMIDVLVCDMNGILRGKQIARAYLETLYREGVRLPGSNYLLDWTGQNIEGLGFGSSDGDPDFFCHPVPGTLKPAPWNVRPSGQVLTSMRDGAGQPHFADPRQLLSNVLSRFDELGYTPVTAIEYEFYLVDQKAAATGDIKPARSPQTGWRTSTVNVYGLDDLADFEVLLDDIHTACAAQGIPAETMVSEYAPGQFEINLHHSPDALLACDQAIMLERCIKQVAHRHGVIATFMAKPFAEHSGSGLHVHVSLLDARGDNVFAGPMDKAIGKPISKTARHAVGGLLAAMPQSMAIFAPNANSYRRLKPNSYAPVTGHWGGDNRTLPLRIPGSGPKAVRIEHRVAGADANPYLVVAAVLAGIHHGITGQITPPEPMLGDAYAQPGVVLPIHWPRALETFAAGEIMKAYFGEPWCNCFVAARGQEMRAHHHTVHALDYEWYLRTA